MTSNLISCLSRIGLLATLGLASSLTSAQMVVRADDAALQPQMGRDGSGFASCGVRAMVLLVDPDYVDAYDFSLMVRADMPYGMLKAGKGRTKRKDAEKGNFSNGAVVPAPKMFWIAREDEGKAVTPLKTMLADTKGYILEIADMAGTLQAIYSIVHGERMQFAIRYGSEPVDKVVSFAVKMPDSERAPLIKCIDGIIERLAAQVKEPATE